MGRHIRVKLFSGHSQTEGVRLGAAKKSVAAMPPKKNRNAKRAGRAQEEPEPEVEERIDDEEDVEYDSDGNEIVKAKPQEEEASAAPGKLSAREIQKLKKRKQKGQLTEEELEKYAEYLGVEERYEFLCSMRSTLCASMSP